METDESQAQSKRELETGDTEEAASSQEEAERSTPASADADTEHVDSLTPEVRAAAVALAREDAPQLEKGDSVGRLTVLEKMKK